MMQNHTNRNTTLISNQSRPFNEKLLLVQVLVGIFLYVNCLMIFTFLKKEAFRTDTRYVLFAQTLFMDSFVMVLTNLAMIASYFRYSMPWIACLLFCMAMTWFKTGTPLTLVAMCLERYVAICMPLRHADISTGRTRLVGLVVIWWLSAIPALVILSLFLSSAGVLMRSPSVVCTVERLILERWKNHLRMAVLELFFLWMSAVIVFTYFKIVNAAKAVASDNKKSTSKGQKTVMLHAIQLLLCLIQFLCPLVESAIFQINFMLFVNVRYFNFVVFLIAPRCLSPLVYGLRDENFFSVLRCYAVFGLNKKVHPTFNKA